MASVRPTRGLLFGVLKRPPSSRVFFSNFLVFLPLPDVGMVFEILGCNLLSIVRLYKSKGLPLPLVKIITKQILTALDFLHTDCSIIHTDLKPENVLLRVNPDLSGFEAILSALNAANGAVASSSGAVVVEASSAMQDQIALNTTNSASSSASTMTSTHNGSSTSVPALSGSSESTISATGSLNLLTPTGSGTLTEPAAGESASGNIKLAEDVAMKISESPSVSSLSTSNDLASPVLSTVDASASKTAPQETDKVETTGRNASTASSASTSSSKSNGTKKSSDALNGINLPTDREGLLRVFGNGSFKCKIADLGNACFTYRHFTDDVQTRHYRAPEVIVGYKTYDTPIDMWSVACLVFELLTGDLLFEPHAGKNYSKDDDHLAQIMELLGRLPRELVTQGKYSTDFMTRNGDLRNIKGLRFWALKEVLMEKYKYSTDEAASISSFLLPMLEYMPAKRATARDRLRHAWIRNIDVDAFETCFD